MKLSRHRLVSLCLIIGLILTTAQMFGQAVITGELTGTVTDASNAVVAKATVTLKSTEMGTTQTTTTSSEGLYRFSLLRPGTYTVTATAAGFQAVTRTAIVNLGQVTPVTIQLAVKGAKEVVEVTAAAPLLQTENANLTTNYDSKMLDLLPNAGGDMNMIAATAPGVAISTGAGYGAFSANGLPGLSNSFTVNGTDNNDPFFGGLANSGASNSTLGANEVQELTLVTNGYSVQYGRSAAATINTTTKSGSNAFHGNASWWWNGREMNANEWFMNQSGDERPFANSNQWAGSIGGPIVKNKLFFFYDNEGLRYVLASGGSWNNVPTPNFMAATLAHLGTTNAAAVPLYTTAFNLYKGAPGYAGSSAYPGGGCDDLEGVNDPNGVAFGAANPCIQRFRSANNGFNPERLMALRIDWNASDNDKISGRWWEDRGTQATYTDPINPVFNATSPQPQDTGQLTWTRVINPRMVNQLILAASHYSAIFNQPDRDAALAAFPTVWRYASNFPLARMGGADYNYPQGRNVQQWQIVDDLSWSVGKHTLKFGVNNKHDLMADFTPFRNKGGYIVYGAASHFYDGILADDTGYLSQFFSPMSSVMLGTNSLGIYGQDEWRVSNKLKLSFGLRVDRNSNMTCRTNCFARFAGPLTGLSDHNAATPYNQAILVGQHEALPEVEAAAFEPRFGFAYSPFGNDKTVIRGGFGIWSDIYPALLAESFVTNPPNATSFTIYGSGATSVVPGAPGSAWTAASSSFAALRNGFAAGQNLAQIQAAVAAAGASYSAPNITAPMARYENPKYMQWNLEVEQAVGDKTAVILNYVGNHGYNLLLRNGVINSKCNSAGCPVLGAVFPSTQLDTRFGSVNQLTNNGMSNYNGVTVSLRRRFTKGFSGQINYTWSHATDNISNGGAGEPFDYATNVSMTYQLYPNTPNGQYGNADYNFPHLLNANYMWELPFKSSNHVLDKVINGWSISGNLIARSGKPYSVFATASHFITKSSYAYLMSPFAGGSIGSCNSPGASIDNPNQCLTASQFAVDGDGYPLAAAFGRNQFRGPKYVNSDMTIAKKFKLTESGMAITFGLTAYNVFNHASFDNPDNFTDSSTFGQISSTVGPPSSPYGNFQGGLANGRLLITNVKFSF